MVCERWLGGNGAFNGAFADAGGTDRRHAALLVAARDRCALPGRSLKLAVDCCARQVG
jgi:hypothetical protein